MRSLSAANFTNSFDQLKKQFFSQMTKSFPPIDDLITFLMSVDYKGIADRIIIIGMYAFAIFTVLGSKFLNSLHLFWELNGETIINKTNRAVDYAYMSAAVVYNQGKNVGERYYSFRDLVRQVAV